MDSPARNASCRREVVVNFNGAIVFDWQGETDEAVTGPRTLVTLFADCVVVERSPGGAQIIDWDWVLELGGWATVLPEEARR